MWGFSQLNFILKASLLFDKQYDYFCLAADRKIRRYKKKLPQVVICHSDCGEENKHRVIGEQASNLKLVIYNRVGLNALMSFNELKIVNAYVNEDISLEGNLIDFFKFCSFFKSNYFSLFYWMSAIYKDPIEENKKHISSHFANDEEFYFQFLDEGYNLYSQALFLEKNDSLETASIRRLESIVSDLGILPGDRVLDISGGFGSFHRYAAKQGIEVISLCLSKNLQYFLEQKLEKDNLEGDIFLEHLYDHRTINKYDFIVNLGNSKHLPNYKKTFKKYDELLKSSGKIYLDSIATASKMKVSSFVKNHIHQGEYQPLSIYHYVYHLRKMKWDIKKLESTDNSYYQTAKFWYLNLFRNQNEVVNRWGVANYRKFLIFLAGLEYGFSTNKYKSYSCVLQKP